MRVADSVAVVTGGASGLGWATTRRLLAAGATVLVVDLPAALDNARGAGLPALHVTAADVTDDEQIGAAFALAGDLGTVRSVVHCAGRGGDRVRILDESGTPAPVQPFLDVVRVNLFGTYVVLRHAAAAMSGNDLRDGDRGAIVLTSSVAAFDGQAGQTSYSAAKAGVHAMTLVAARDLGERAIRVNTIAPGVFDTPMFGNLPDSVRTYLESCAVHPRRLGIPEEFAELALQLLENSYMNGHTTRLDAGIRLPP